jgi:hypothetical protein
MMDRSTRLESNANSDNESGINILAPKNTARVFSVNDIAPNELPVGEKGRITMTTEWSVGVKNST